ncbi:MAG: toprim domain-containing protein, partial (plasmid) [Phytoplasma sp.]|uniref:toprim domain-containing protein n=1 Tax=Phytoplasma sp. TaxID=2155 RepID=UPI002B4008D4
FLISHKKEFEELKTPSIRPQTSKIRAIRTTNKDNHCIGSRPFLTPPILAQKQVFFNKVAKFYHESLLNNSNMLNYLMSKRKITLETIQTFKIGYSDKNNNKLLKLFREENKEHLLLFDLIKYNQKQNFYYDSLTDGFVLPVFHHETSDIKHLYKYNYQAITPFNPKYKALINQNPDSIFYYPYGFFQAQQTILETQTMIIHEGFFDVISCHQNDIKNVVGLITIKSYLSKSMVDFLKTNHITVIIGLDDDESGLINSLRLKQQLDNENIPNIIKQIPSHYPFKDADDLLRNDNSNLYKKIYC